MGLLIAGLMVTVLEAAEPRVYEVYLLEREPELGAAPDEYSPWNNIPAGAQFYRLGRDELADRQTVFGIGYSFDGLWIGVKSDEPDMAGVRAAEGDGGSLWAEDGIEIFFSREGGPQYHQFIVNTLGSRWSRNLDYEKWEAFGFRGEEAWFVELKIPFEVLGGFPEEGETWFFNIVRTIYTLPSPQASTWSPRLLAGYGEPENFGRLVFMEMLPPPEVKGQFEIDRVEEREDELFVYSKPSLGTMVRKGMEDRQIHYSQAAYVSPRLDPSRKQLLYHSKLGGALGLWRVDLKGGELVRVTDGRQGVWSPDGNRIAFVREGGVFEVDLNNGDERLLTPEGWDTCGYPSYRSNDEIIFVASRNGEDGIYSMPTGGSSDPHRLLVAAKGIGSAPSLSPDGSKLAYQDGARIRITDLETGEHRSLASSAGAQGWPVWAEDGMGICFIQYHDSMVGGGDLYFASLKEAGDAGLVMRDIHVSFDWVGVAPNIASRTVLPEAETSFTREEGSGRTQIANAWLSLQFDASSGDLVLASKKARESTRVHFLDQNKDHAPVVDMHLLEQNGKALHVELKLAPVSGEEARVQLVLSSDSPILQVTAPPVIGSVSLIQPFDYLVVPDRLANDIVLAPSSTSSSLVNVPRASQYLVLSGDKGEGMLSVITTDPQQSMVLSRREDAAGFGGVIIRTSGEPFFLVPLQGPALWSKVKVAKGESGKKVEWKPPFQAQWRFAGIGRIPYSETLVPGGDGSLESLSGVEEDALEGLVYLYARTRHTPVTVVSAWDGLEAALGPRKAGARIDREGIVSYRVADEWVPLHLYREYLLEDDEVRGNRSYVFAGLRLGTPASKQMVQHWHDDIIHILQGLDQRIVEYRRFFQKLEDEGRLPQGVTFDGEHTAMTKAAAIKLSPETIQGMRNWLNHRANSMHDKAFTGFLEQARTLLRERQEVLREYRTVVKELRDQAGRNIAAGASDVEFNEKLRDQAAEVLRNRYYFEGDWRGEQPVAAGAGL